MAHVGSRKLSNALEGALAGGGDPATSPLYVFGPFLKLIVAAGVARITFGATVWLVVLTIAVVSAMYRRVMVWITDGSGGSGLSEEEFGGWAVKVNAGITFIEYTLTFLVSTAALVTFIADRLPFLNSSFLGMQYRAFVAVALSVLTGWLVNRGPKVAARAFGPATGAVLLLLWAMVFATLWRRGLQLPDFNPAAFRREYLFAYTLAGYSRILAVMTGVEVFANLVAAYSGTPEERSRKAFGSLLIIMGTTSAAMLIVGPAIFALSDPLNPEVSVFTQTMDRLLPAPLPYLGTLVGIAVLLSASAASAQGLQNLALGLGSRQYIPATLSQRNRYEVADKPVWLQVGIVSLCFLLLGTHEETYLALYAAGVFILLSMTGWAATKRLSQELRGNFSYGNLATFGGTLVAAVLTTTATLIIFEERFWEGAWIYLVFIPLLYALFTYSRARLGAPTPRLEALGRRVEAMPGMGLLPGTHEPFTAAPQPVQPVFAPGTTAPEWRAHPATVHRIMVPLDGSQFAEQALPLARQLCLRFGASLTAVSVITASGPPRLVTELLPAEEQLYHARQALAAYLAGVAASLHQNGLQIETILGAGPVAETIVYVEEMVGADLTVMSTHGRSGISAWLLGRTAHAVVQLTNKPLLLIRPQDSGYATECALQKVLVLLDGSRRAEQALPYAALFGRVCQAEILVLRVPEIPEPALYGHLGGAVEGLRLEAESEARAYVERIVAELRDAGLRARGVVTGSHAAATIVEVAAVEKADMIILTTHGRGGMDRLMLGSVADRVVHHATRPVLVVPVRINGPRPAA